MSYRFRALLLATSALVPLSTQLAHANPLGGQVVGGSATIAGQGTANVTVTQSTQNAIINWQTFNIGAGETTQFVQPNASSVVLDRVTGGLGPSTLYGTLKSNGEVFLVNPDGVLIGPTGKINTSSFLATTQDISNSDFMAGKYNFSLSGRATASVVNEGSITAQSGGFAALVAPGVRNTGTITATLGTVALASGNAFSLDFYGDQLIRLGVNDSIAAQVVDVSTGKPLASLVSNEGVIKADGGRVELTAVAARAVVDSVINNSGVIEANTIGKHNGMIMLGAATASSKPAGAPTQLVKVSGKLSAAGKMKGSTGGTIVVTGESIQLANAQIDASGQAGGGKVLIGGDTGGGKSNPAVAGISEATLEAFAIPTASNVSVDAASTINASAVNRGNGGKIVVWADGTTSVAGAIAARGGAISGDGGFVETSGHDKLAFSGSVNVGAAYGVSGTWLLDPTDLTIASTGAWVVAPKSIEDSLATGNVLVTTPVSGTDGNITVAENVSWASAFSLTLSAFGNIAVDANIVSTGGAAVTLRADNTGTGVGTVSFGSGATISTSGVVSIFYNPSVNPAGSLVNASSYVAPTENFSGDVKGGAQLTAYMLVNTFYDLQNIQNNLNGDYALGANINASTATSLNGGAGFEPIGTSANLFEGVFDGQNYTISNLTINSAAQAVGLFAGIGTTGTVRNLGLTNITVNATLPDVGAGTLGSYNLGTVSDVYATGSLHVASGSNVGGLIGTNDGMLERSYAAVSVSSGGGNWSFGGLVGANYATITQSYATGSASGGNSNGGLVGYNAPTGVISQSYASGQASGYGNVGGLVGWETGVASQSYALTTAPASLPTGFDPTVWAINASINNGYPYLLWQTATTPTAKTLSGGPISSGPTSAMLSILNDPTGGFRQGMSTLTAGSTPAVAVRPSDPAVVTAASTMAAEILQSLGADAQTGFLSDVLQGTLADLLALAINSNSPATQDAIIKDIEDTYTTALSSQNAGSIAGGFASGVLIGTAADVIGQNLGTATTALVYQYTHDLLFANFVGDLVDINIVNAAAAYQGAKVGGYPGAVAAVIITDGFDIGESSYALVKQTISNYSQQVDNLQNMITGAETLANSLPQSSSNRTALLKIAEKLQGELGELEQSHFILNAVTTAN